METKTTFKDFLTKPPVMLPLVALAHIVALLFTVWQLVKVPSWIEWLNLLWMVAYTIFWLGATAMRKWGVWGYVGVTAVNIMLFWYLRADPHQNDYLSSLFLFDILFSFFLLLYYKRFS
ncbi:MAG: hypothetical protein H7257_06350 [Taibaiella sp.]|nr:hypothetical protein [Taibaiella sp.]